jgi:hypothetical protein
MNDANLLRSRVAECNAESERCADFAGVKAQQFVGDHAEPMSDEDREDAIVRAGKAMAAWYSRFQASGDAKALDIAYRLLHTQKTLIEGRSAAYVAKLEQERANG